ncbi:MAG: hypothetical protein QOI73_2627 [Solirubrobacteraceae bacterium]|nr:hypothetical protein [Solirubrobacteraceae bacterium]
MQQPRRTDPHDVSPATSTAGRRSRSGKPLVVLVLALVAVSAAPSPASGAGPYNQLERKAFNRLAVRENLSLFWVSDADADGVVDPNEVTSLLFYPPAPAWTDGAGFTADFDAAYARLVAAGAATIPDRRLALVAKELDQGTPTLIRSDLSALSDADKAFVGHMSKVADLTDELFDRTSGAAALAARVPADPLSQSLFRRNRGPACLAPATERARGCSAIPGAPKQRVDYYPRSLQAHAGFCKRLEKRRDAKRLLGPFTVVRRGPHGLKAVPYTVAYRALMTATAVELDAAAASVTDPAERPLVAYLQAAAHGFRTNSWGPADEAWSRMNAENSAWYVRVGPDEVYADPCAHKAGFHLTFARINPRSLELQRQLSPLRQEMESAFAARAGRPYKARTVRFHLPDFIDIVMNTGDDRFAFGITTGQSLPNWGKVAEESRGRTVVMSNVDTDADSTATRRLQAESLLDAAAVSQLGNDPESRLRSTILHEASHNLGPTGQYHVRGRSDQTIFGGDIASVLEELKADAGGQFLVDLLHRRGMLDDAATTRTYLEQFLWAFGQISNGAYSSDGARDPYAQLAAVEVGFLLDRGALTWRRRAIAANGVDRGAFAVHTDKLAPAYDALIKRVVRIKARGDKAGARRLLGRYVDGSIVPQKAISRRMLRYPKASFVYSVGL